MRPSARQAQGPLGERPSAGGDVGDRSGLMDLRGDVHPLRVLDPRPQVTDGQEWSVALRLHTDGGRPGRGG